MSDLKSLLSRIDTEFSASEKKIKDFQAQEIKEHQGRQKRLELFASACDQLRDIWRPRLEGLAQKFGDKVKVTPTVTPIGREATFQFKSPLATIVLRFSATTDFEVRKLILDYNLHILPILMRFDSHARTEMPLDAIDSEVAAQWIDDRIVDFVRTYLELHQNEHYLKEHMVSDPISGTYFPKYAAAEVLEWQGTKYYFVGSETRKEFEKQKNIVSK